MRLNGGFERGTGDVYAFERSTYFTPASARPNLVLGDEVRRAAMVSVNTAVRRTCPSWCTVSHRRQRGEDDLVHIGEPVPLSGAILARLCMSVTPDGEVDDGPYVLVGSDELTLEEARRLGERLVAMADEGKQVSRRGGA